MPGGCWRLARESWMLDLASDCSPPGSSHHSGARRVTLGRCSAASWRHSAGTEPRQKINYGTGKDATIIGPTVTSFQVEEQVTSAPEIPAPPTGPSATPPGPPGPPDPALMVLFFPTLQ